ncbi:MAG: hypothetical protein R3Y19_07685 [Rikenellaceae bacterium]
MKHFRLFMVVAVLLTTLLGSTRTSHAQSSPGMRSIFDKAEIDDQGKRIYEYLNPHLTKVSISGFYGIQPVNSFDWFNSPAFSSKWSNDVIYSSVATSNMGAIGLGFNFFATPALEISLPFIYTRSEGYVYKSEDSRSPYEESWLSMMPGVKFSWLYNDWFTFYSRASVGWSLGNRSERTTGGIGLNHTFALAYQISPVGVEFGRRLVFFVEAGFGTAGKVSAGLKLRFSTSDDSYRKADNWYESYM